MANAIGLMDGDLVTPWRFGRASRGQTDIFGRITVDLGLVYWVDEVRLIGRLVLGRGFDFKFYEVMTSDGSLGPDGTALWFKHFSGHGSQTNRREGMADHPFPLRPVRLVRIGWKYWDAVCAVETGGGQTATTIGCQAQGITEELQAFGTGYPLAVTLRSQILDLQGLKNFTNLEWEGETPPGTRHEIRTRTGNDLNSVITFHNKDGKEITERAWGKRIPSFRGSIDTTFGVGDDWSPWSRIYHTSAQAFQSPVPRRYVQVDVWLVSEDPEAAASLEMLQINFDDPLARDVVAEIAPALTTPAVQQAFSLFVRPRGTVTGFDYLSVEASTQLNFVEARLGGERFDTLAESTDNGFRVALPRRVQSNELLELSFDAEIYLQSTRFDVFLEDRSGDVPVRQRVDAGDATDRAPANTNIVSLPLDPELFVNVDVSSRVLMPNGDGQNDELQVALDVLNLIEERPLRLRIMELSGRVIRSVARGSAAGQQHLVWDARDESGVLVPPGIYILELNLQGDGREESLHRLVTVVYQPRPVQAPRWARARPMYFCAHWQWLSYVSSGSVRTRRPGTPTIRLKGSIRSPSRTTAPAPMTLPLPTCAPESTMAPMPIRQPSSIVQACRLALCPTVTSALTMQGRSLVTWTMLPSWMLLRLPMRIALTSPRTTALNQIEHSSPSSTSPMIRAPSATKTDSGTTAGWVWIAAGRSVGSI